MADDEIVRLLPADTRPHDDWFRDIGLNRTGFDGADGPTRSIRQSGIPSLPVRFDSATPLAATGVGRMFLRATLIAAAIATAALAMAGLGAGLAHAGPNQTCTPPQWVTDWGVLIGSRVTCFNPDGSGTVTLVENWSSTFGFGAAAMKQRSVVHLSGNDGRGDFPPHREAVSHHGTQFGCGQSAPARPKMR